MQTQITITDPITDEDIIVNVYMEPPEQPDFSIIGKSLGYPGYPGYCEAEHFSFPKDYDLVSLEREMARSGDKHWNSFLSKHFSLELEEAFNRLLSMKKRNNRYEGDRFDY